MTEREQVIKIANACQRTDAGEGYQICDRCRCMWGPLLGIEQGWLPLACVERTPLPNPPEPA